MEGNNPNQGKVNKNMEQPVGTHYQDIDREIYPISIISSIYTWIIRRNFFKWGKKSRIMYPATVMNPEEISVGNGVFIREHSWLNATLQDNENSPTLSIGDYSYIGRFVHINAYKKVEIESNVLIADRVFISDVDHSYKDKDTPIMYQDVRSSGVVKIRDGSWIGIGAVIMPGVTIGKNSVVGANSVVTHNVSDYTVVAGIPAREIKTEYNNRGVKNEY